MNQRTYVGAKYVPTFAEPSEWDANRSYEALTIVISNEVPYTSKKPVPAGVQLNNSEYWVKTPIIAVASFGEGDVDVSGNIDMNAHALKNVQEIEFANSGGGLYVGSVVEPAGTGGARLTGTTSNRAAFVKPDTQATYVPVSVGTPTQDNDAGTKAYIDNAIEALKAYCDGKFATK